MAIFVDTSKVFQYGKTTIPKDIREKLNIRDGDFIVWMVDSGRVMVSKREPITEEQQRRNIKVRYSIH